MTDITLSYEDNRDLVARVRASDERLSDLDAQAKHVLIALQRIERKIQSQDEFLSWLISLDDPENPQGIEDRKTITLTQIIQRARKVMTGEV